MKRIQRGIVTYVMLVGLFGISGGVALTQVGPFTTEASCKAEIVRMETEDKAIASANPGAPQTQVWRRCARTTW